jgi:hypothetical protein
MTTNRIKAASMTVFANDTQLDRLQAFGVSARLDSEDLKEIGNLDIVEVIDNIPTVDITVDSNQYGSVKTLRKFARKNFDWGTINVTLATSASITITSGYFYIDEMKYTLAAATSAAITAPTGATRHRIDTVCIGTDGTVHVVAGTATTGTPTAPATTAGHLKLAEVQSDSDGAGNAVAMTALSILNCYDSVSVALRDFEFASVDFACPVKESGDNTTTDDITRTMYLENAFINRYDASFSTNGVATESFSLETDNKTWFLNTGGVIYTDRYAGTGTTSGFTLTYAPTLRTNSKYTLGAYLYNKTLGTYTDLAETTDYTVASTTLTCVTPPTSGQVLVVRYPVNPSLVSDANMPFMRRNPETPNSHPAIAGGLKHGQVEIYLSDDASNPVLRLQTVSISTTLAREALYEIGHFRAYDRPMTFPIPIQITVDATAGDLKEFVRLCGGTFATATEVSIKDFIRNLSLTIKIYREDDVTRAKAPAVQSNPIKTITIPNVVITDESNELRVDGNGTQTFGLKASTTMTIAASV